MVVAEGVVGGLDQRAATVAASVTREGRHTAELDRVGGRGGTVVTLRGLRRVSIGRRQRVMTSRHRGLRRFTGRWPAVVWIAQTVLWSWRGQGCRRQQLAEVLQSRAALGQPPVRRASSRTQVLPTTCRLCRQHPATVPMSS